MIQYIYDKTSGMEYVKVNGMWYQYKPELLPIEPLIEEK